MKRIIVPPNSLSNTTVEIKVLIIGDVNVGKSAIVNRFTENKFDPLYLRTTTPKKSNKEITVSENKVTLQISDIGSQEFLENPIENIYKDANIILFVFDATNEESFRRIQILYKEAKESNTIKVLVGNKYDLTENICVGKNTAEEYVKNSGNLFDFFIDVSANNNQNIKKIFTKAVEKHFDKNPLPKQPSKQEMKEIYYKNVRFFSFRYFLLFSCLSRKSGNEIIADLKKRAATNQNGASAKTLNAFNLKKNNS